MSGQNSRKNKSNRETESEQEFQKERRKKEERKKENKKKRKKEKERHRMVRTWIESRSSVVASSVVVADLLSYRIPKDVVVFCSVLYMQGITRYCTWFY
jgi:hypothetical protein